ncbi:hypothetical protein AYI68_g4858 [Smittium mucronatum]|uniref:Uncharacterized protein n=1 Tax=Smittium mucronatum TaxID=133383 RepID=A0A1R0GVX8_9FUNG|nr:hypothetical protein AYI68_g4858 [Smittium mucronatum]
MKKRKRLIEKTIILTKISFSVGLTAAYLREKGLIYQTKDPPWNFFKCSSSLIAVLQIAVQCLHYSKQE